MNNTNSSKNKNKTNATVLGSQLPFEQQERRIQDETTSSRLGVSLSLLPHHTAPPPRQPPRQPQTPPGLYQTALHLQGSSNTSRQQRRVLLTGPPLSGKTSWLLHLATDFVACCASTAACTSQSPVIVYKRHGHNQNESENDFPLYLRQGRNAKLHNKDVKNDKNDNDMDWNTNALQQVQIQYYNSNQELLYLLLLAGTVQRPCRALLVDDLNETSPLLTRILAVLVDTANTMQLPLAVASVEQQQQQEPQHQMRTKTNATQNYNPSSFLAARYFDTFWNITWDESTEKGQVTVSAQEHQCPRDYFLVEYQRVETVLEWNLVSPTTAAVLSPV